MLESSQIFASIKFTLTLQEAVAQRDREMVCGQPRSQPLLRLDSNAVQKRAHLISLISAMLNGQVDNMDDLMTQLSSVSAAEREEESAIVKDSPVPSPVLHPAAFCVTELALHCSVSR